jgi:hypothetical protein
LQKNPSQRYQIAAEMLANLRDSPLTAPPQTGPLKPGPSPEPIPTTRPDANGADHLPVIAEAIKRYNEFENQHRATMLRDRIRAHKIDTSSLNLPIGSLKLVFDVKEGLMDAPGQNMHDRYVLDPSDGGLYFKSRGYGPGKENIFVDLIRCASDVEAFISEIRDSYHQHKNRGLTKG